MLINYFFSSNIYYMDKLTAILTGFLDGLATWFMFIVFMILFMIFIELMWKLLKRLYVLINKALYKTDEVKKGDGVSE